MSYGNSKWLLFGLAITLGYAASLHKRSAGEGQEQDCPTRMDKCFYLDGNGLPPEDSTALRSVGPDTIAALRETMRQVARFTPAQMNTYICAVARRNEKCLTTVTGCQDDPDFRSQDDLTKSFLSTNCTRPAR